MLKQFKVSKQLSEERDASNMHFPIGTFGKGKPRQEQRIRRESVHLEVHHHHVIIIWQDTST